MYLKAKASKPKKSLPSWLKAIPEGSHGSGTVQKRLWRVVSDYTRLRDWYYHKGVCVASGIKLSDWREGQAGHFLSYSTCNGLFKFDERNVHLQSAHSNQWGRREDWQLYEATLIQRYGVEYINMLEDENRASPLKFTVEQTKDKIQEILKKMATLPEQPEYYKRVMKLI